MDNTPPEAGPVDSQKPLSPEEKAIKTIKEGIRGKSETFKFLEEQQPELKGRVFVKLDDSLSFVRIAPADNPAFLSASTGARKLMPNSENPINISKIKEHQKKNFKIHMSGLTDVQRLYLAQKITGMLDPENSREYDEKFTQQIAYAKILVNDPKIAVVKQAGKGRLPDLVIYVNDIYDTDSDSSVSSIAEVAQEVGKKVSELASGMPEGNSGKETPDKDSPRFSMPISSSTKNASEKTVYLAQGDSDLKAAIRDRDLDAFKKIYDEKTGYALVRE